MRILLCLAVLSLATVARADIPPEPGYVEQCTVEKQQKAGQACIACGDSYHGDVDACQKKWQSQGYAQACKSRGASVWTEVWCKADPDAKAAPAQPAAPQAQSGKGCSVAPGTAGVSVAPLLVALSLLLARRRRRS